MLVFFQKVWLVLFSAPIWLVTFCSSPLNFYSNRDKINTAIAISTALWGAALYRISMSEYGTRLSYAFGVPYQEHPLISSLGVPVVGEVVSVFTILAPAISICAAQMIWTNSVTKPLAEETFFTVPVTIFGFGYIVGAVAVLVGLIYLGTDPTYNTISNLRTIKVTSDILRLAVFVILIVNLFRFHRPSLTRFAIGLVILFSLQFIYLRYLLAYIMIFYAN